MAERLPKVFIWRRLHSLLGLWLVIFLMQHLFVNAQAALLVGHDGEGFIHAANTLESLPFLPILEALILGLPIVIHTVWGIKYLRTAEYNTSPNDGSKPSLPMYGRNQAYTWQRITAWVLVLGIVAHVVHMRFVERPLEIQRGANRFYMVRVGMDAGLPTLAARLNIDLFDQSKIVQEKEALLHRAYESQSLGMQQQQQDQDWIVTLTKRPLRSGEVMAVARDFGRADLLMLRETFKQPIMLLLYTLFVLTAVYHAFNGFWTFLIKWGITMSYRAQMRYVNVSVALMILFGFLGLAAIWGTYWINLRS